MFVFQPSGGHIRPVPVLNPLNVGISYARSPRPGSAVMDQKIKISMQPMDLYISYQVCQKYPQYSYITGLTLVKKDFKLVMSILNNSMPQQPQQQTPPNTLTTELSVASDLTNSATSLPSLPPTPSAVDESLVNAEVLVLSASSISMTLINDLNGRNVPIAELRLSDLDVDLRGWSSSV